MTWKPVDIVKAVEAGYLTKRRESKITKKTSFAPSSIGYKSGTCPRRWFYAFSGEFVAVDDTDATSMASMGAGTSSHERIQEAMEAAGILQKAEMQIINSDPPVRGYVDVIVNLNDKKLLGEIKTTREEAFMWRKAKRAGTAYHMYQILLYMRILGYDEGFLLYENKSNNELLCIPVKMDVANATAIDEALEWMREVWKVHQDNTLPVRPFTQKSLQCKDCPFYEACWSDERVGEVTVAPMKVAF